MSPSITSYTSLSSSLLPLSLSLPLSPSDWQRIVRFIVRPNSLMGEVCQINWTFRYVSIPWWDLIQTVLNPAKRSFFAPLLKIVNDNKNHKIYFYRSSTIYSRGGQAFLLDALPLLIFSKDPLRQCNVFRHLIYLLSRYSCYLWIPQHWVAVKACVCVF